MKTRECGNYVSHSGDAEEGKVSRTAQEEERTGPTIRQLQIYMGNKTRVRSRNLGGTLQSEGLCGEP